MKKIIKKFFVIFQVMALVMVFMPTMSYKLFAAPAIGEDGTTGKMVTFTYDNADATSVYVAGNFNNFTPDSEDWKMERNGEGIWELTKEIPSGVYGYKFVVDGGTSIKDPANYSYYTNTGNSKLVVPGDVQSPVVEGDTVTFNFPREQVTAVADADQGDVTRVCVKGEFNGWADAEMTLSDDGTHFTYTASGLEADTYEYGINVYTTTGASWGTLCKDYYNMEAASDGGNSIFTIEADVTSPVVNGNDVTFNFKPSTALYDSVVVAGTATSWDLTAAPAMEYDSETGIYSLTIKDMVPGTYQYKFVGNPSSDNPAWMLDPANTTTESGNSAFTIAGLKPASGLTVKKGETLELPSTLTLYAPDGTTTDEAVMYVVDGDSTATISEGILAVPENEVGDSLTLTASTAAGDEATVRVELEEKVCTSTIKVHFLSKNGTPNIYFQNITPAAALEAPEWPGIAMTDEGDGWFGYELPGVDTADITFSGEFGQTAVLSRTSGEWWYAADTWFDHKPTSEELTPVDTGDVFPIALLAIMIASTSAFIFVSRKKKETA